MLVIWQGVNVTLGFPIIRTSVEHGTDFANAGRGTGDPRSLIQALKLAATRVTDQGLGQLSRLTALETLEKHGLLRPVAGARAPGAAYTFAHDLVRQVVYADLSQPRRRLMHSRLAHALHGDEMQDESVAAELAYHAGLAGEPAQAARACVVAGRRCLRLFANTQAEALARRGRPYAAELAEPDRLKMTI